MGNFLRPLHHRPAPGFHCGKVLSKLIRVRAPELLRGSSYVLGVQLASVVFYVCLQGSPRAFHPPPAAIRSLLPIPGPKLLPVSRILKSYDDCLSRNSKSVEIFENIEYLQGKL
jgi:hypothetical protein